MTSDRDALIEFIGYVEETLAEVVDARGEFAPTELQDPLGETWPHIKVVMNGVRTTLREGNDDLDKKLAEAGLTGSALELKLTGVKRARARWLEQRLRKLLLSLLRWIDILLGSLSSVIPGAEIVKEYKETLERVIAESEE